MLDSLNGVLLLLGHGYRPPLIPNIWIDGQEYNNPLEDDKNPYAHLTQRLCDAYKGDKRPKACSAF